MAWLLRHDIVIPLDDIPPPMPTCSLCHQDLARAAFSAAALKKHGAKSDKLRCEQCRLMQEASAGSSAEHAAGPGQATFLAACAGWIHASGDTALENFCRREQRLAEDCDAASTSYMLPDAVELKALADGAHFNEGETLRDRRHNTVRQQISRGRKAVAASSAGPAATTAELTSALEALSLTTDVAAYNLRPRSTSSSSNPPRPPRPPRFRKPRGCAPTDYAAACECNWDDAAGVWRNDDGSVHVRKAQPARAHERTQRGSELEAEEQEQDRRQQEARAAELAVRPKPDGIQLFVFDESAPSAPLPYEQPAPVRDGTRWVQFDQPLAHGTELVDEALVATLINKALPEPPSDGEESSQMFSIITSPWRFITLSPWELRTLSGSMGELTDCSFVRVGERFFRPLRTPPLPRPLGRRCFCGKLLTAEVTTRSNRQCLCEPFYNRLSVDERTRHRELGGCFLCGALWCKCIEALTAPPKPEPSEVPPCVCLQPPLAWRSDEVRRCLGGRGSFDGSGDEFAFLANYFGFDMIPLCMGGSAEQWQHYEDLHTVCASKGWSLLQCEHLCMEQECDGINALLRMLQTRDPSGVADHEYSTYGRHTQEDCPVRRLWVRYWVSEHWRANQGMGQSRDNWVADHGPPWRDFQMRYLASADPDVTRAELRQEWSALEFTCSARWDSPRVHIGDLRLGRGGLPLPTDAASGGGLSPRSRWRERTRDGDLSADESD